MLDRTQPHEEVFGIPGIKWSQGGRMYNPGGAPVTYRRESLGTDADGELMERTVVETISEEPRPLAAPAAEPTEFDNMHWKHLKVQLEMYGEPYVDKASAIAFLRGKGVEV